jgi:hypothetical protein
MVDSSIKIILKRVNLQDRYVYKEVLWKHHGTVKKLVCLLEF